MLSGSHRLVAMTSIVTGEAVVLELRPASFAARGLGLLIDVAASLLLYLATIFLALQLFRDLDTAAAKALQLSLAVFYLVIVPVAVETLTRGKSLGKYAMGLRIVRDDGGSIRFRQALIRGVLGFLEVYGSFGSIAFLASLFNERSKRLGDMLAGTYSMRERVAAAPILQIQTPQYLLTWVKLADIGRLPDGLARRISQFMYQASKMTPLSRADLARSLADEASAFVSPAPPPGTLPDDFLAALSVERRERDYRRLMTAKARAEKLGTRLTRLPFES